LSVVIRNRQTRPILDGANLAHVASVAFAAADEPARTVGVAFVDDVEMIAFHESFMQLATTTDVLSFPADAEDEYGGDVIVCTDQAARQAFELGLPYQSELVILVLHGVLHLLGYDHTTDEGTMTRLEEALRPRALHGVVR
jgi:probable rRNA maturation factor